MIHLAAAPAPRSLGAFTRRLTAAMALGAIVALGTGTVQARVVPRAGISVDVTQLLSYGLGSFAEGLRADLAQALEAEFAGRLAPGQRILVQIHGLSLNSYVGEKDYFGPNDYLDGVVTLIGADGRQLASQKILTVLPSSYGGAWYIAGGEQRRAAGLARSFASWARRYTVG